MPPEVAVSRYDVTPTGYTPDNLAGDYAYVLQVEFRGKFWYVKNGPYLMSCAGNWKMPRPFQLHQYRWLDDTQAIVAACRHVDKFAVGGKTYAERYPERVAEAS